MNLKAIIFDVDGTIAETEQAHRHAFNFAFAEAGREWIWSQDDYRDLLKVTGGKERIRHYLSTIGETLPDATVLALHQRKNALYAALVADGAAKLRPGIARLIGEAREAGVRLAIATTTSRANLTALLEAHWRGAALSWFDAIVTGEDVARKKPDPEVYARALSALGLPASVCVAVEDSRNGVEAARGCGIAVLATPSFYTTHDRFDGATLVRASLDDPPVTLADLDRLVAASTSTLEPAP